MRTGQKVVYLPIAVRDAWQAYQREYPEVSFSPLVAKLIMAWLDQQRTLQR